MNSHFETYNRIAIPRKGTTWRHAEGRQYVVTAVTNLASTIPGIDAKKAAKFPVTVSYRTVGADPNDPLENFSTTLWRWGHRFTPA